MVALQPCMCAWDLRKSKEKQTIHFRVVRECTGPFSMSRPAVPAERGPLWGSELPAQRLGFAELRPINRTLSFSNVRLLVVCCSLCRVAATPMRIHHLHAGRPQQTGTVHSHSVPRGHRAILAPAGRRRWAAVCRLLARKGCRFAHFVGKASPNGSVQKRQLLLKARNRGGNLLQVLVPGRCGDLNRHRRR